MDNACLICGSAFQIAKSQTKRGRGKYCSRDCYSESLKKEKQENICSQCLNPFLVSVVDIKRGRGKYCGRECASLHRKRPAEERFWEKTRKLDNGCIVWLAYKDKGYGKFNPGKLSKGWFIGASRVQQKAPRQGGQGLVGNVCQKAVSPPGKNAPQFHLSLLLNGRMAGVFPRIPALITGARRSAIESPDDKTFLRVFTLPEIGSLVSGPPSLQKAFTVMATQGAFRRFDLVHVLFSKAGERA